MTADADRKRLRELNHRIPMKREDQARLREELAALQAERKALKEKLDAEADRATSK